MITLQGRTCVFAGATGILGRGAVKCLAEGGMNVVMVTHDRNTAKMLERELENCPGKVIAVSNEDGDAAAIQKAYQLFGSVDVVINTTGGLNRVEPVSDITESELTEKLNHQITAPFLMAQAAIPFLEKSAAGRIIFLTSAGAQDGFRGENIADSIARGGVITMVYALAKELAEKKITVNAVARSGMVNDHEPKNKSDYNSSDIITRIPVGRLGTAEEFGAMISYLASEEAGFVTGQIMGLTGGIHIG